MGERLIKNATFIKMSQKYCNKFHPHENTQKSIDKLMNLIYNHIHITIQNPTLLLGFTNFQETD